MKTPVLCKVPVIIYGSFLMLFSEHTHLPDVLDAAIKMFLCLTALPFF
jgi:hypothetical protein